MLQNREKSLWLIGFIILVLLMISLGGVTRLTRSGLSIVEWRPVTGIIPPLTDEAWNQEFTLYQQSPEYQKVNSHFSLEEYKSIYLWEYLHRVLGRIIFLYVLIPGLILWRRKMLEGKIVLLLSGLVVLQGLFGWLMVKSGLNNEPRVSPYMLTLHFCMALAVLVIAYSYLSKTRPKLEFTASVQKVFLIRLVGFLLALQILYGCLTSGLKAGHTFSTFPLMGDQFLPPMGLSLSPLWTNLFENPITVQWVHRWLGISLLLAIYYLGYKFIRLEPKIKGPFIHLMGITTSQVIFGILILWFHVPIFLAVIHQALASLIVLGYFNLIFRLREKRTAIHS